MLFPHSQRIRGLVDCDSFFASCEIYAQPKLAGRPVCVGKQIVLAASYEAKAYGVKTGTPVWEAKKMLPRDAVFLPVNFVLYETISQQLISYLRTISPDVQPASIDEAFIDLTNRGDNQDILAQKAEDLKHVIKNHIGIPISLGIAKTKLLAKLGASKHKPFGSCVLVDSDTISTTLHQTELKEISFIGRKTAPKLQHLCHNAEEFRMLDYRQVKQLLGSSGAKIRKELNGYITAIRDSNHDAKSISRTRSFDPHFTHEATILRSRLVTNIEKAYRQLLKQGLQTKGISVMLRTKGFHRHKAKIQLPQYTADKHLILQESKKLFTLVHDDTQLYRSTGIYFWDLTAVQSQATSLFDTQQTTIKQTKLQQAIQHINHKSHKIVIQSASALQKEEKTIFPMIDLGIDTNYTS